MAATPRTYGYGNPAAATSNRGAMPTGNAIGRSGINNPTQKPKPPTQADLIGQQPLPVDQSAQYQQMLAQMQAQMDAMRGYGSQVAGLQAQLNRGYAADPTGRYINQLMQMYAQGPSPNEELLAMLQPRQRTSRLVYGYGM